MYKCPYCNNDVSISSSKSELICDLCKKDVDNLFPTDITLDVWCCKECKQKEETK